MPEAFEELHVNHAELPRLINECWDLDIPLFLLGPPGIGKSEMAAQAAEERGAGFHDVRLSQMDAIDTRGLPIIDREASQRRIELAKARVEVARHAAEAAPEAAKEIAQTQYQNSVNDLTDIIRREENRVDQMRVRWAQPDVIPEDPAFRGILMLDELNTAPPSVQVTMMQLMNQRCIGPHKLSEDTWVMAAGNRKEDNAKVVPMTSPLRSRMYIVNIDAPSVSAWTQWAMENDIHPLIIGFIRFKSDMLYQPPGNDYANFATPRAYAQQIDAFIKRGLVSHSLFAGSIGDGAAASLIGYINELSDLPDIDDLLHGRVNYDLDDANDSVQYAVTSTLAQRVLDDHSILPQATRLATECKNEITAVFAATVLNTESIAHHAISTPAFMQWARENRTLLVEEEDTDPNNL